MYKLLKQYAHFSQSLALLLILLLARMTWHGSIKFAFLFWNLFLAILPLALSHFVLKARNRYLAVILAMLWLLFFPNAAYLVTDIVHLNIYDGASFWLDLTLLFGAGLFGVAVAVQSLSQIESWYLRYLSVLQARLLTLAILAVSGYGIYLGRVERWNSWDLLCNTGDLLATVFYELRHPFRCAEVWAMSGAFASAMALGYFTLGRRQIRA